MSTRGHTSTFVYRTFISPPRTMVNEISNSPLWNRHGRQRTSRLSGRCVKAAGKPQARGTGCAVGLSEGLYTETVNTFWRVQGPSEMPEPDQMWGKLGQIKLRVRHLTGSDSDEKAKGTEPKISCDLCVREMVFTLAGQSAEVSSNLRVERRILIQSLCSVGTLTRIVGYFLLSEQFMCPRGGWAVGGL